MGVRRILKTGSGIRQGRMNSEYMLQLRWWGDDKWLCLPSDKSASHHYLVWHIDISPSPIQ